MTSIVITLHLVAMALALGGRLIFAVLLQHSMAGCVAGKLEQLQTPLTIVKLADWGLLMALLSGLLLFFLQNLSVSVSPWSFKLKVVLAALLIIAIGAFHIAQMRVVNHYDVQMLPVLKRLNIITVALLSGMVFFATFAIN
jgi:hypothetical protein